MFTQDSLRIIHERWDQFVQTVRDRANDPPGLRLGVIGLGLVLVAVLLGVRKDKG